MGDLQSIWIWLLTAAYGVFVAIFGWAFKRNVKSQDEHNQRIAHLEQNGITRAELDKKFDQLREDRMNMHNDNIRTMEEMRRAIDRVHERVDGAYRSES